MKRARGLQANGGDSASRDGVVAAQLSVIGMDCEDCAAEVRRALSHLGGVVGASVALRARAATVVYDPRLTFPTRLLQAVRQAAHDGRHHFEAAVTRVGSAGELRRRPPRTIQEPPDDGP